MKKLFRFIIFILFFVFVLTSCGKEEEKELPGTLGFEYQLSNDNSYYILAGKGDVDEEEIIIPTSYEGKPIKEIGPLAFRNMNNVKKITIQSNIKTIGVGVFYNISEQYDVYYYGTIKNWLDITFMNENSNPMFNATNLYFLDEDGDIEYNGNKYSLPTEVVIPNGVTQINDYAFYGCKTLTNISIPNTIQSIGNSSFYRCENLTYNDHDNARYLGNNEKKYLVLINITDTNITSFNVLKETKIIFEGAFILCKKLENITFEELSKLTTIGAYAFSGCVSLKSVEIPNGVLTIGAYAFSECSSLTNINIPSSVTTIGAYAFNKCISLTNINISSGVTKIEQDAFYGCSSLTSITIPESVTSIEDFAFSGCSSLTNINIPSSVTTIGCCAFKGCSSLTNINIPSSVTSIGYRAFENCINLKTVTIEEGSQLKSIGSDAFSGCVSLSYNNHDSAIYLGNNENKYLLLIDITDTIITSFSILKETKVVCDSAFHDCKKLKNITFEDGCQITSLNYTFSGCSSLRSITIPNCITTIGESTFEGCSSLTNINIPSSVTSIEDFAFSGCSSLTSITIPESVTSIEDYAFSDCRSLTSINIPSSVTTIGFFAFTDCISLTDIIIPSSVKTIESFSFERCYSLKNVYYCGTETEWESIKFESDDLTSSTIYYYSETIPISQGNYWYYDSEGNVCVWN